MKQEQTLTADFIDLIQSFIFYSMVILALSILPCWGCNKLVLNYDKMGDEVLTIKTK